ncbi:MAG: cellulase family glycosylhydrolase [Anaerolineae bacterium]|nr:cellulase family glycosylhydrolase [Anaerolineae bacterium]
MKTARIPFTLALLLLLLTALTACGAPAAVVRTPVLPTYSAETKPLPLPTDPPSPDPPTPLPTYDARSPTDLCTDLHAAWNNDWPRVIHNLERLRDQQGTCDGQNPTLTLYPAYYNYGAWLERRGDRAGAISAYQKALAINPQGQEAAAALQKNNAFTPMPLPVCSDQRAQQALAAIPAYTPQGKHGFVKVQGSAFVGSDGQPFRPKGINYYPARAPWRRFLLEADPAAVAKELDLIRETGINTLRIFLWYDALFDCPGSGAIPKPAAFARLDAILKRAADKGYRLIVTLNDLPDLTIRPLYQYPESAAAQTAYIVQRYRDEPVIMAWDVRNEGDIDITRNRMSSRAVLDWLRQTTSQIRQLDTNHLITAGWNESSHMTESAVDFVSFHHWTSPDNLRQRIAALRVYTQKPILLEETGFSTFGGNEARQTDLLRQTLTAADAEGIAGWLVWTAFDFSTDVTCLPPACPSKDNGEHHFGLWRTDYSPKPAVEMLRTLITR